MKKRVKALIGYATLALMICATLSACAFNPNTTQSIASPNLHPVAKADELFNQDDLNAIPAPDVYQIYDDLDSLVKGSDLIAIGRVNGAETKRIRLCANGDAFQELFNEEATMFDIQPLTLIKGDTHTATIRMASFPSIVKNTIVQSTLDLYTGESVEPKMPDGSIALFFLKNVGDMYFPVNLSQGFVPVLDERLTPQASNSAISPDTELPDVVDSIRYLMNFLDEPTTANYRPFKIDVD